MSIKISGLLKENNSSNTISGLYVEAYNDAHTVWLGGAKSDVNGRFTFYLREDTDMVSFPIMIVIYRNNIPYYTTKFTVFQEDYEIILSSLNERALDPTHEVLDRDKDFFILYGTLKDSMNRNVSGATISVYATGFRSKNLITKSETNGNGYYSVKLARASLHDQGTPEEKGLTMEASIDGENIFASSGELFNIPLKLEVNLQSEAGIYSMLTEYDTIYNGLQEQLGENTIDSITIEGDDRESVYLSKILGEDEGKIITLVKAFTYAAELDIDRELVYGLLRADTSMDKKVVFNRVETNLRNAIAASEENKTISVLNIEDVNTDIGKILQWQITNAKQVEIEIEETTLENIFTTAFANETYLNNLLSATRDFTGESIEDFWTEYTSSHGSTQTEKVQKGLQLLAVTGLQPKMTKYLLNPENFNQPGQLEFNGELSDLVKWSHADWEEAIEQAADGGSVAVPKSVSLDGNADDIPVYAVKLKEIVDSLHPTASINARIAADASLLQDIDMQETVTAFLTNNPDYDFRSTGIYEINAEDFDLEDVTDLDALKAELAPFQRLARLTGGKPEAMTVLKAADLTSAHSIVNTMNLNQFLTSYGAQLGGTAVAAGYYDTAKHISAVADEAAVHIAQYPKHIPFVLGNNQPIDPVASPELATLFGSLEQCGCEYCMSLYSPSAYYVDILNFVKKSSDNTASAFDELARRRPDLLYIDLTCKNANTPVPYIDLVNELLELEILRKNTGLPGYPSRLPLSYQTEAEAVELSAYPEHYAKLLTPSSNPAAYDYENSTVYQRVYDDVLSVEKYPDILPFNLAWEEARVYLKHLGKSRYELMYLFKPLDQVAYEDIANNYPDQITYKNLLGEYLGISKQSADHITQTSINAADIAPYYGLSSSGTNNLLSPSDTSIELSGSWSDLLTGNVTDGGIDVLLSRLDISYKELLQLLTTESLNKEISGTRKVNIMAKGTDPATCILKELKLDIQSPHSAQTFFGALHRFVRFWRVTKLSIYELDAVLTSFNISSFNPAFLSSDEYKLAARAIVFARQLNVSVDEIATWWSDISEVQYTNYNTEYQDALPSFYDKLFKSKLVKNPFDDAFDKSNLSTQKFEDHIPAILAAAGIKEEELNLLIGADMLDISLSANMSISELTMIFREAMAARVLGVSVKDLTRIYKLLDVDPVPAIPLTYKGRQELLERLKAFVDTLNNSRLSLSEWEYLIKNDDVNAQLTPAGDELLHFHESLQTELYKVAAVLESLDPVDNEEEIKNIKKQLKNILIQKYSTEFGVNADMVQYLLEEVMTFTAADTSEAPLLEIFITESFYKDDLSTGSNNYTADYIHGAAPATTVSFDLNDMYDVYLRFAKIALMVNKLKLKKEELKALQGNHGSLAVIDILLLEGNTPLPSANTIGQFTSFINWVKVRDLLNIPGESFSELIDAVLAAAQKSDWTDAVADAGRWDKSTIAGLVGTPAIPGSPGIPATLGDLMPAFPSDFKQASLILRIADIINACTVIGITPGEFKRMDGSTERSILWANLQMQDSEKVIKTARAKYTEAAWSKVAKPLRDELREKQRKALVAYLLVHPNPSDANTFPYYGTDNQRWRNENELYAYFLIDVEMSPCMKTSRTKQAISSVQLFMDRVMMNLEHKNMMPWESNSLISIAPDEIEEWKTWRKWYRIWEANRKIFLYPENWIEPELRDGKSPEFVEFETHLMQDDVTSRLVEEAYIDYLEKLDDFARLEPVTNYHETEEGIDIIHAFARTHVQPHHYYYRRFESNEWTPWEKINLDIKGDHFTAYVKNKRLYIFWLTFVEKQTANDTYGKSTGKIIVDRQGTSTAGDSSTDDFNKWKVVTWLGSMFGFYNPSINTVRKLSNSDELSKKWDIYLNWSEYKDQKWQKSKVSKEKMELVPHIITISPSAESSVTVAKNNGTYNTILDFLTHNAEISPGELFRNRIYLSPGLWNNTLYMSLQLTDGMDEYCVGIHAFRFTEDMREVEVLRTDELEFCTKAPNDTLIANNKFIESPAGGSKKLWVSNAQHSADTHYGYTYKRMEGSSRISNSDPAAILDLTPQGTYKIAAKSNLPDIGNWGVTSPTQDHFFFEDDTNTYFVKRIFEPFSAEVLTGEIRNPGTLRNLNETNIFSTLRFAKGAYATSANLSGVSLLKDTIYLPSNFHFTTPATSPVTVIAGNEYYKFETFYHPHADNFIKKINTEGIKGLLNIVTQDKTDTMNFSGNYQPTSLVYHKYPTNVVDFDYSSSYSLYNWELFFHMPMTIAQRLTNNQQFEEAQKWYHYIFDPTSNADDTGVNIIPGKERFWRFRPFYEFTVQQQVMTTSQFMANMGSYNDQIAAWEKNPFKPHVIARMRILAYMKNVVMKYIDNLIAWGDQLFRRDTIESVNEATQLYILAANILGERPLEIPARAKSNKYCFLELDVAGLNAFSNAQVEIEAFMGPNISSAISQPLKPPGTFFSGYKKYMSPIPSLGKMSYFCLSNNDKLLGYWDTVADRLFKIRNCRNIDGVLRELPLYEPPIDPALLVKAAAAGVDINSVLDAEAGIGMPHYRFGYVLQKANELCADVRGLGSAVLSALEKKDAEVLALLRSGHEITVMEKVKAVKEAQVKEAEEALNGLQKTKEATEIRYRYYSSRPFMNSGETQHLQSLQTGMVLQASQAQTQMLASALSFIPQFNLQAWAAVGPSFGGQQLSTAMGMVSQNIGIQAMINSAKGNMAQVKAGYERRMDDWKFQVETAQKELEQIDKQIIGAEIRLDIAQKELGNHELQMENSREADEFMRSKFTNAELYNWMTGQLATVYFQSYQLAYDLAKKAERCYDYELPHATDKKPAAGFIKFGYWDSLRKGLLAGEKLQFDLRKMDASYMEQNKRELELTKHVSLALTDPEAILDLRKGGYCAFSIPEELFDLDYPGHYRRRIKSVSISIPCIAGPYTTIGAKLSQTSWKYREKETINTSYAHSSNYKIHSGVFDSIATSSAQNDSGVFELNFKDERYVPFEGTGAISGWSVELPEEYRQFDYSTISDVIMHIKYTAVDGTLLKEEATANLNDIFDNAANHILPRYFSLRHEFSNEWYAYANEADGAAAPANSLELKLVQEHYPFFCKGKSIENKELFVQLKPKAALADTHKLVVTYDNTSYTVTDGLSDATIDIPIEAPGSEISIQLTDASDNVVNIDTLLDDIYLVTYYQLTTN